MAPVTKLAEEDGSYRRVGIVPANPMKQRHHCEQIGFQYFTVKELCGKSDDRSTVHLLLVLQFSFLLCFN